MKRLMMTIAVVVVLVSSSAEAQFAYLYNPDRYVRHGFGHRHIGRMFGVRCGHGSDSTFGKIMIGGSLLNQILVGNKLVDHRISMDNQALDIIRRGQAPRYGQHRIIRGRSNTVVPIRRIIKTKPKKTQMTQMTQTQKSQELQQQIQILELELEKLKLQQELEKAKK